MDECNIYQKNTEQGGEGRENLIIGSEPGEESKKLVRKAKITYQSEADDETIRTRYKLRYKNGPSKTRAIAESVQKEVRGRRKG